MSDLAPGVWADLVGQQPAVAVLRRAAAAAEAGRHGEPGTGMTHAWLVTGPPGSGRSTAARAFAAALQCPNGGCGKCPACHTVLAGTHADVEVVNTRKLSIGVPDARALVSRAARYPSGGRWQVEGWSGLALPGGPRISARRRRRRQLRAAQQRSKPGRISSGLALV